LSFQLNTEGITFTVVANHLNSAVSQTQDYCQVARKIQSTNTNERQQGGCSGQGNGRFNNRGRRGRGGRGRGGRGGRGSSGEKGGKGGFNTSYYSAAKWNKLSFEERDKIRKERDKKGEQGGSKQSIGDLWVEQFTAIISAVKSNQAMVATADSTDTNTSISNAGNTFGGKEGAKQAKFS
jgi:hypothetical protein